MLTKEQSIESFKNNMNELINSNYILVDKKISVLLKGISISKLFFELFKFCTSDYNYDSAKNQAIVMPSKTAKGYFVLPNDSRSLIAFVFSMLCELDSKEMDLLRLLDCCFNEGSYPESYKKFAADVLAPFRDEVVLTAEAMINEREIAPVADITKAEGRTPDKSESVSVIKLLDEGRAVILQHKMAEQEKMELMMLFDDLKSALYGADAERIKLSFLGYKYAVLYHKKLNVNIEKIEKLLFKQQ